MSFQIPLHFEDLTRSSAEQWRIRPTTLRGVPAADLLEQVTADPSAVLGATAPPAPSFVSLYTLISQYTALPKQARVQLIDFAATLVDAASPTNPAHVKLAAFVLAGLCTTASAASPTCKHWEKTGRESALEALCTLITATPCPSPFPPSDLDQVSSLLVRTVLHILEQPSAARDKNARPVLSRILAAALSLHQQQKLPAITALLHALSRHEHLPGPLADILYRVVEEYSHLKPFVAEFVCEIARLPSDDLARDLTAAKSCAAFIGELSEKLPDIFRSNLALVLSQLDGDSYTMRNGIVQVIGILIRTTPDAEDPLLDVLMERAHRDINAFTRSKAMQTWISLAQARVIPNRLFPVLADMAAARLDDKTAAVRKYATQLLGSLLTNNPFGPALLKSHFQRKLTEVQGDDDGGNDSAAERNVDNEAEERDSNKQRDENQQDGLDSDESEHSEKENETPVVNEEEMGKVLDEIETATEKDREEPEKDESHESLKKRYYTSAVAFIQSIESGLETVYNMLRSKSITDVSEAVAFLITAVQFQLEAASGRAVRKMLPLVLARENNIRQAAVSAYVRLLAPGGVETVDEKESAIAVAMGFVALGVGATTGEIACLEALIAAMCKSKETAKVISMSVVAVLWDIFAGKVPGASEDQRRAACILVGMVAADLPESLRQRVSIIETAGLPNPSFARWSCVALCKLPMGSDHDSRLSKQLVHITKTSSDLSTVEQAINAIFVLSPEPELAVASIIRELSQNLHGSPSTVPVKELARFLHVVGHVAVKELVRIEALVSQVRKCAANSSNGDSGNNEEEEQASAEADKALELAEQELVNPISLLGRYGNLARKVAADRSAPSELQSSSVLCMAKLMCVQEKFCQANLRLLFSILSAATEPLVRSNAVTALGDLAFRFPNLVEPWSSHIYGALQDKDEQVRKNTLMALTHLILNDMVKVKGQIVNLAICILDPHVRIADLARLFFHELARKSTNAIYNILPDTISCMSRMSDLNSDGFKTVVSFLVSLMDKEKHADGMVEKLCHRFRTNETERENQDLSYCISQLNISERGIKKMNDSFKSYSSAICDDVVHSYIMQAVNRGNKNSGANTTSQVVEELTAKIDSIRQSAAEAENSEPDTHVTQARLRRSHRRSTARSESQRSSVQSSRQSETSGNADNSDAAETGAHAENAVDSDGRSSDDRKAAGVGSSEAKALPRRRAGRRRRKAVIEEDEESEDTDGISIGNEGDSAESLSVDSTSDSE